MNNFLIHYGVKGQQWGILHGPPYPVSDKGETRIKAGYSKIHRLSMRDESASKGHAYVTFLKSDSKRYKGFFGMRLHSSPTKIRKDVYQYKFKNNEDLVSPSKQKRVDTFLKMYKKDPILRDELKKYYKKEMNAYQRKDSIGSIRKKKIEKLTDDKKYNIFSRSIGSENSYIRDKYFKELSKQGYNFVIDDLDAGKFGKQPAIIFNREKTLTNIGKKVVSKSESLKILKSEGFVIPEYKEKKHR